MQERRQRYEFKAVIDGIALPEEAVRSIDEAIQKTMMTELADIDLAEAVTLALPNHLTTQMSDDWGFTGTNPHGMTISPATFWTNR